MIVWDRTADCRTKPHDLRVSYRSSQTGRQTRGMPGPGNVSIITLGVGDVEASGRFYAALGWPHSKSSVDGTIHWFDVGGVTLAVNLGSRDAVDGALASAVAAGATVTLAPMTTDYGVYHACFADPDGHVWEVAWNPGFPVVDGRTVIP
jgi:predicted lactoylglutathione lyase